MAGLDRYEGPAHIFVGARLLAEAKSIRVRNNANNHRVYTMKKGLAGKSDGPRETEIELEEAVPIDGEEIDFVTKLDRGTFVRVVHVSAGVRRTYEAWVENTEHSNSTDNDAALNVSLVGRLASVL